MSSLPATSSYNTLLSRVKKTLLEGRARIEQERVRVYWKTGRIIHADILKHKDRAGYGKQVIERLSADLDIHTRQLRYCVQFFRTYPRCPIVNGRSQFSWTHFRAFMRIPDRKKRLALERTAARKGWTSDELAVHVKAEKSGGKTAPTVPAKKKVLTIPHLTPRKRGKLYTYTTANPPEEFAVTGRVVADCGFNIRRQIARRDWPKVKFQKQSDYTYRAVVRRVIDGDTLKVELDLGLDTFTEQKLRLRGIDCPEIKTVNGQKAKAFVQRRLRGIKTITVVTSKSDKYDRYLADVWYGEEGEYLNQELLNEGLAKKYL